MTVLVALSQDGFVAVPTFGSFAKGLATFIVLMTRLPRHWMQRSMGVAAVSNKAFENGGLNASVFV